MTTHILLIESDDVTRILLRYHLVRAGYVVAEATPGDVLPMLRHQPPQLVIADQRSRLDNGQSVEDLWHYNPESCSMPLLMLTDIDRTPSKEAHCHYLAKPVLARQLLQDIGSMLSAES